MAENNYLAAKNWATRPPDQRYWSVSEFEAFAKKEAASQAELTLPLKALEFVISDQEELLLQIVHAGTALHADMNSLAFRQLASRLDYPTRGLDPELLTTQLIADILNHRLRESEDSVENLMLLTQASDDGQVTVKSVTSDSYARFHNIQCVPLLRRLEGFNYRLPPARPAGFEGERTRIATADDVIKNNRVHVGMAIQEGDIISPSGLYCGEEDFFSFMINDIETVDDGAGNALLQGIMVRNSDVGVASFQVSCFIMAGVCGNHIIQDVKDLVEVKYRHVGDAVKRIHQAIGMINPVVDKERLDDLRLTMAWMARNTLGTNLEEVIANAKHLLRGRAPALTEKAMTAAYLNSEQWRDVDGNPQTYLGFVQALTRWSQTLPYQNVRKEIDKGAGLIISEAKKLMS